MPLPPALRHEHPIAMAHRGSMLLWPENTMTAFQGAVDLGYRYLETDLQISRDGVLVAFHDNTLDRTTDGRGPGSDYLWEELREMDAGYRFQPAGSEAPDGGFPYRSRGVRIPALEALMTAYPEAVVSLDLKGEGLEEPLVELINRLDLWDRVIVGSFKGDRLKRFRSLAARPVATSAGPGEALRFVTASRLRRLPRLAADALQVPIKQWITVVSARTVATAHAAGLPLSVWTINDPEEMRCLLDLGVDGLITDRPDLLRALLEERGRPPPAGSAVDG